MNAQLLQTVAAVYEATQWQNCEEKAAGCVSSTVLHSVDIIHSARPLPRHAIKITANLLRNEMQNPRKKNEAPVKRATTESRLFTF